MTRRRPVVRGRATLRALALAALVAVGAWSALAAGWRSAAHPRYLEMLEAARTMQRAMQVVRAEKEARGLLQGADVDPNRTGFVGPEWTPLVTTLGHVPSKRTATNPDLAAALVRAYDRLGLDAGDAVVVVLSGSFPAANVAAVAAAEVLGLRPFVVASVGASMHGATDLAFTYLDLHGALVARGVVRTPVHVAAIGGTDGSGGGMDPEGIAAVRAAAERGGVALVEADTVAALVDAVDAIAAEAVGGAIAGVVNVGGAVVGIGACVELLGIVDGTTTAPVRCVSGDAGLMSRYGEAGAVAVHVLNLRFLSLAWGLPYDPVPLPAPGNNVAVYRR